MLEIRIEHAGRELHEMARRMRRVGEPQVMRRAMLAGLKEGAKPAVRRAQSEALALPSRGRGHTGFRRKMASAISVQVSTTGRDPGVRVRISKRRMGSQASLASATNKGRWRHPVYGNRHAWVTQTSKRGWFDDANRYSGPAVRTALKRVLDDIEKDLSRRI